MTKFLQFIFLASLLFISFGTLYAPNNVVFWLAASSREFEVIRIVVASLLLVQFVTQPPRHIWFRLLSATGAIGLGWWTVAGIVSNTMPLLDVLIFIGAACTLLETSLERRPETSPPIPKTYITYKDGRPHLILLPVK